MKKASGSPFASVPTQLARRIRQRKKPVQQRSKETTDALLTATLQVLLKEGYGSLTTTRIAERAGVSVGTLYQYYPDRRSLVMALKLQYFGAMLTAMNDAVPHGVEGSLDEVLRLTLGALLRVKRENIELAKALRAPMAELDGSGFVRGTLAQFVATMAPRIARADPSIEHVERKVTLFVAAVEGALSFAVHEAPEQLLAPWFLEDLVALGQGLFGAAPQPGRRTAKARTKARSSTRPA